MPLKAVLFILSNQLFSLQWSPMFLSSMLNLFVFIIRFCVLSIPYRLILTLSDLGVCHIWAKCKHDHCWAVLNLSLDYFRYSAENNQPPLTCRSNPTLHLVRLCQISTSTALSWEAKVWSCLIGIFALEINWQTSTIALLHFHSRSI